MSIKVWVGLGSNLGEREQFLKIARRYCRQLSTEPLLVSSIYETPAWGGVASEPFLNQVIGFNLNQRSLINFIQHEFTELEIEPTVQFGMRQTSSVENSWFKTQISHMSGRILSVDSTPVILAEYFMLALLLIERRCGRDRSQNAIKWGSRTVDLDLLEVSGGLGERGRFESPLLTLPHPRLHERDFVLAPWAEIAPSLYLPAHEATVKQLYTSLLSQEHGLLPYYT